MDPTKSHSNKFYIAFASIFYALAPIYNPATVSTRNDFIPFIGGYIKFLQERKYKIWRDYSKNRLMECELVGDEYLQASQMKKKK